MFHRNAADNSSSNSNIDPSSRIWPSNFRRSAAGAAASGPERKSSDQVIQQLRDELDRQRQMFFERLPKQWEESTAQQHSRGFPFGHQQHRRPFHHEDAIPSWMMDDGPDGYPFSYTRQRWPSDGGSGSSSSGSSNGGSGVHPSAAPEAQHKRTDSPSMSDRRMHKPAARSATGDFPPGSFSAEANAAAAAGFTRASSAPPVGPHPTGSPSTARRTFTTTVRMDPSDQPHHQTSSPGPNRRHQQPTSSSGGGGSNVRHIPIMVEGRDEPLLPSVAEEDAEKRSKTAIPMPFYPTDIKKTATQQHPKPQQAAREPSPQSADGSVPIPLPYDRLSDASSDSGRSAASGSSSGPAVSADMELIGRIQKETESLLPRIESFQGDRNDRDFLFLDEMLTRLLLKLDNVQVEGREDIRQARRKAITSITRCINLLESKIQSGINRESQAEPPPSQAADKAIPMEVDQQEAQPSQQQQHVSELVINLQPSDKADEQGDVKPVIETQL